MSELARPEREDDMTKQIDHVTVVGAGGMGALFGAILSEGGLEVTLVVLIVNTSMQFKTMDFWSLDMVTTGGSC